MKRYQVYGLGAALLDTEIRVTDQELSRLGIDKGLMTLVDEGRQDELLGMLRGHLVEASHASGGSAGNSLIAAARFGGSAFMTCKVANDEDGDIYLADLEAAGVDHPLKSGRQPGTTGKCLVLITPDAERSMNTYLGVSETLSVEQLDPEALSQSEWVYLEGYLVTSPTGRAAAVRARELAQENGVRTALSFSDPGIVGAFREGFEAVLGDGQIDLVFGNLDEAMEWTGADTLEAALEGLTAVARQCVITRGSEGAVCFDGRERIDIPPHRVQAIDTNGAGDMFAGAFLYALGRGEDVATAGRFASLAAGEIVTQYGPRLPAERYAHLRREFFGD